MHDLKLLRHALGLTQGSLAALLGVSRPLIAMAEAGRRELPATAHRRLLQLTPLAPLPNTPASGRKRSATTTRIPKHPDHYLRDTTASLQLRGRRLLAMAQQLETRLQAALLLQQQLSAHTPATRHESLLQAALLAEAQQTCNSITVDTIAAFRKVGEGLVGLGGLDER